MKSIALHVIRLRFVGVSMGIGMSMFGCGGGDADRSKPTHDKERAAHQTPVSEDEQSSLEAAESLSLTGAQLSDVKIANASLTKLLAAADEAIADAKSACRRAAAKRTAVVKALEPVAGELAALQDKAAALEGSIEASEKAIAAENAKLAAVQGELDGAKKALAAFGPDFSAKMKAEIDAVDAKQTVAKADLKVVRKQIKEVLASLPYDGAAYGALRDRRDDIEEAIDLGTAERAKLVAAKAAGASVEEKKKLQEKVDSLTQDVKEIRPIVKKALVGLKAARLEQVEQKTSVDAEIDRDTQAKLLVAGAMPEGCKLLDVSSK